MDERNGREDKRESLWLAGRETRHFPQLDEELTIDTLIIGGGLTGLSCAWHLAQQGVPVAVLEADVLGGGTSARTTGKVTSQHDLLYATLQQQYGNERAQMAATANEKAITTVEETVRSLHIDCAWERQSAYTFTQQEDWVKQVEEEARVASSLGIQADCVGQIPLPIPTLAAVRFQNQAQFHPVRYMDGLIAELERRHVPLFEQSRVVAIDHKDGNWTAATAGGPKATAKHIILATLYPIVNKPSLLFTQFYVQRSYLLAFPMEEPLPDGMYINAEEPVRSLRHYCSGEHQFLLVGGEGHRTGQCTNTERCYHALVDFAQEHFKVGEPQYSWSAQDCMTMDGLPLLGALSPELPGLLLATGFHKWGMTSSAIAALLLTDLIVHGRSDWADAFSPHRGKAIGAVKRFVVENAVTAKELVRSKLATPEDEEGHPIARGTARVLLDGNGARVGVYRDEEGNLHSVDTTCPHMGCELAWNPAERSWDCPCHGSRFSFDGEILNGPAVHPLNEVDVNTIHKLLHETF